MDAMRALIVEDDEDIRDVLTGTLTLAGFEVEAHSDGHSAVNAIRETEFDIVTLDLGLPNMDGIEVCRRVREISDCYIIIVSARGEEIDRLLGLEVGADDFLVKPFSPRELRARVAAMLRRPRATTSGAAVAANNPGELPRLDCGGGLTIHQARREVEIDGKLVPLTRIEYDVLEFLAVRMMRVCTREEIVNAVWKSDLAHDWHLVDVHVANLRGKLRAATSQHQWIRTVRGVGYRLDAVEESA